MTSIPLTAKITVTAEANPHRGDSKDFGKFNKLKSGMTVEDAIAVGLDKGYLIYAHRRNWLQLEGVEITQPKARTPSSTVPVTRIFRGSTENQVYLYDDPEMIATLLVRGPDQSEIKFPNGNVRTVSNTAIKPVKE